MSHVSARFHLRSIAILLVTWFAPTGSSSVIYVRAGATGASNGTNWADAYQDLQLALLFSQAGDEIRVAQGTYKPAPPGNFRSTSFVLRSGVSVRGGFAGSGFNPDARNPALYVTILSGDINGTNAGNSYHVVSATDVNNTALIDGFTITGGRANANPPNERGGGLRLLNSSVRIRACVITGNTAGRAPGIHIEGGAPSVSECLIQQNTSQLDGGAHLLNSNAVFESCRVSYNSRGGGISCLQGSPVFRDCEFENNTSNVPGGGLVAQQCTPTLIRCI